MVAEAGLEPAILGYEPSVLPLHYPAVVRLRVVNSDNRSPRGCVYSNVSGWHTTTVLPIEILVENMRLELIRLEPCKGSPGALPIPHKNGHCPSIRRLGSRRAY
jgi:hypothetical protein